MKAETIIRFTIEPGDEFHALIRRCGVERVAKMLGCSHTRISAVARGEMSISASERETLARALAGGSRARKSKRGRPIGWKRPVAGPAAALPAPEGGAS